MQIDMNGAVKLAFSELDQGNYELAENSFKEIIKIQESGVAWRGLAITSLGLLCQLKNQDVQNRNKRINFIFNTLKDSLTFDPEDEFRVIENSTMQRVLQQVSNLYSSMKSYHASYIKYDKEGRMNDAAIMILAMKTGDLSTSIKASNFLQDAPKVYQAQMDYISELIQRVCAGINNFVSEENENKKDFFRRVNIMQEDVEWYILDDAEKKQILDKQTLKLPASEKSIASDEKMENNRFWLYAIIILLIIAFSIYKFAL